MQDSKTFPVSVLCFFVVVSYCFDVSSFLESERFGENGET